MKNDERAIKIELLKRKNRRSILINSLAKYINVSHDSFLEPVYNDEFCKKVFNKLYEVSNKTKIGTDDYKQNISLSLEYLNRMKQKVVLSQDEEVILFFYRELEIEAIKIKIKDVFKWMHELLGEIGFLDGLADFILIKENLELGICIERTEYYYEFCFWGI